MLNLKVPDLSTNSHHFELLFNLLIMKIQSFAVVRMVLECTQHGEDRRRLNIGYFQNFIDLKIEKILPRCNFLFQLLDKSSFSVAYQLSLVNSIFSFEHGDFNILIFEFLQLREEHFTHLKTHHCLRLFIRYLYHYTGSNGLRRSIKPRGVHRNGKFILGQRVQFLKVTRRSCGGFSVFF